MNLREAAKQQRREQIVAAARRLIRRAGNAGFSMRDLAEASGVSPATPYNLFGTKRDLMFALLDAEIATYRERLDGVRGDPVDVLFAAVSEAVRVYAQEPGFHRAVLAAVFGDGGRETRPALDATGHAVWRDMVQAAVDAGALVPETHPDLLALELVRNFFACVLDWVRDLVSLEELETWVHYSFAMTLSAMATEDTRKKLQARIVTQQRRLLRLAKVRIARLKETAAHDEGEADTRQRMRKGARGTTTR